MYLANSARPVNRVWHSDHAGRVGDTGQVHVHSGQVHASITRSRVCVADLLAGSDWSAAMPARFALPCSVLVTSLEQAAAVVLEELAEPTENPANAAMMTNAAHSHTGIVDDAVRLRLTELLIIFSHGECLHGDAKAIEAKIDMISFEQHRTEVHMS